MKYKISHFVLCIAVAMAFTCQQISTAKKISTRIQAPKPDHKEEIYKNKITPLRASEFRNISKNITFMAYEKKTSSDKETFFIDNGSDSDLTAVEIEISYFNSAGKLIHKRSIEIDQQFPAKETRKVDIPSWDKQKSFHYVNSVPSSKGSTPYTVGFKLLSFITEG